LAALIGLAAINVFVLLFVVPKFEEIFAEALPGKPLPGVTNFVLGYRSILIFGAIALPVVAILLRKWQKPFAVVLIHLGIVWFLFELGGTIIALFMPMAGGLITGMPDAGK